MIAYQKPLTSPSFDHPLELAREVRAVQRICLGYNTLEIYVLSPTSIMIIVDGSRVYWVFHVI